MTNFTVLLCAIVLCLSFKYGNTIVNSPPPKVKDCNSNPQGDPEMVERLNLIKSMMRDAWNQNNDITDGDVILDGNNHFTMVQMLSNLWVMGLRDQFECGKKWIADNYYSDPLYDIKYTFLASTEYMGSLLSCYALTNDKMWLDKAKQVGNRLESKFDTPTGLPSRLIELNIYITRYYVHLAEAGGQHLEFTYLADMTNDSNMKTKVSKARTFLQNNKPNNGLYLDYVDVNFGEWSSSGTSKLFWHSNTFYPYLVKSFVQSNGRDGQAIEMYREAIDAMVDNLVIRRGVQNSVVYAVSNNMYRAKMDYNYCYFGAMLALGADAMQRELDRNSSKVTNLIQEQTRIRQHWTLAKEITQTCHAGANSTKTKLPSDDGSRSPFWTTAAYAESYFVLWRLTHDVKYRDYAWELAQAINRYSRCENWKFFHQPDVHEGNCGCSSGLENAPKLHHLSTTLKYLYLTFTDDSVLPLDQWVFNRVGQPLPVCGNNVEYPAEKCMKC